MTESSRLYTNCGKWVHCWIESIISIGMCMCSVYVYVHYIHVNVYVCMNANTDIHES